MPARITRKFGFDSGHRVLGHESKCAYLHGHRYTAEVTVEGSLDELGRVIDFSCVKQVVGHWIDEYWDHNMLLNPQDPLARNVESDYFGGKLPYLMPNGNPTAENMAEVLFETARSLLFKHGVAVTHVRMYETPNCWADYGADDAT